MVVTQGIFPLWSVGLRERLAGRRMACVLRPSPSITNLVTCRRFPTYFQCKCVTWVCVCLQTTTMRSCSWWACGTAGRACRPRVGPAAGVRETSCETRPSQEQGSHEALLAPKLGVLQHGNVGSEKPKHVCVPVWVVRAQAALFQCLVAHPLPVIVSCRSCEMTAAISSSHYINICE